jgi:hypothetical protein
VMLTLAALDTATVATANVAEALPPGTVMFDGTAAMAPLLLDSRTVVPQGGAGALSVTVPVEPFPPTSEDGLSVKDVGTSTRSFMVRVAERVVPAYAAEIETAVTPVTSPVVTAKVILVAPEGTVTANGTAAAVGSSLVNCTYAPPAGAGPLKITVPVAVDPSKTLEGVRYKEPRGEKLAGRTVRSEFLVIPPYEAEIVTPVGAGTVAVCTRNVAALVPARIVTLEGTAAVAVCSLNSITAAPPAGAGPPSVTVPVAETPPCTADGLKPSEASVG